MTPETIIGKYFEIKSMGMSDDDGIKPIVVATIYGASHRCDLGHSHRRIETERIDLVNLKEWFTPKLIALLEEKLDDEVHN